MDDSIRQELEGLPTILDFADLQSALRLSARSIWRILQDPRLHAFRDEDGSVNVLRSDLINWLDELDDERT
ncbi:MAG: hypothetical protein HDR37_12745 [Treponema sp.]|nr:hypothetical protein [Treponema sp.]MBD5439398.1 hypothetical protein [Treponema sp.]